MRTTLLLATILASVNAIPLPVDDLSQSTEQLEGSQMAPSTLVDNELSQPPTIGSSLTTGRTSSGDSASCTPKCHKYAVKRDDSTKNWGYTCECKDGYLGDGYDCCELPVFLVFIRTVLSRQTSPASSARSSTSA